MEMTLRWYGSRFDTVTLEQIRQIPSVKGVITTLYDKQPGQLWTQEEIHALKQEVEASGLHISGIESVNVSDAIKAAAPGRDQDIDNYIKTLENLGKEDIHLVCYNFMPVFDWTRTDLNHVLPDGSTCLAYYQSEIDGIDPVKDDLSLPGWDASYSREELRDLILTYRQMTEEDLWENLAYFLHRVIPVAAECDVNMAIHPDDPCWSLFGLPRIITCEENLDRFLALEPDVHNGLTLCTGSLGSSAKNDLPHMAKKYAEMGRIHFAHLRQVALIDGGFEEHGHLSADGSLDLYEIVKSLEDGGFDGYVRPDHGRMIWGETGRPGYGLYDRALGAAYLNGLFEAVEKGKKHS